MTTIRGWAIDKDHQETVALRVLVVLHGEEEEACHPGVVGQATEMIKVIQMQREASGVDHQEPEEAEAVVTSKVAQLRETRWEAVELTEVATERTTQGETLPWCAEELVVVVQVQMATHPPEETKEDNGTTTEHAWMLRPPTVILRNERNRYLKTR